MNKRVLAFLITLIAFSCILISAGPHPDDTSREQQVWRYFSARLDTLQGRLSDLRTTTKSGDISAIRQGFADSRAAYKHIEAFVEYYYPSSALRINGAALLEAEPSEPEEPQHPSGFQVVEELLFGQDTLNDETRLVAANEINTMEHDLRRVQNYVAQESAPSASAIFGALRLNLHRLIAKGISGFDSPVLLASLEEGRETLAGLKAVLSLYHVPRTFQEKTEAAIAYLRSGPGFDDFDRADFLTRHLLPLMEEMHSFQKSAQIPFTQESRAVRTDAVHFFEADAFNRYYFAPGGTLAPSQELIALGRALFYDPALSATRKRSCASCHEPGKAFTDGMPLNASLIGGQQLLRNTPTLLNAALQPVQFADSRIAFLEDQIHDVVSNKQEMGGDFAGIVTALKKQSVYQGLFSAAFPSQPDYWQKAYVKKAIAAYVRSLVAMNSRFDRYMQGDAQAINREEVRGFNLFMGKAKCGTCHYAPLFSGAVPPLYDKMESEVLGLPSNTDTLQPQLDKDPGKYRLYKMPHQMRSFKTTGLRNVALTAPYMHNGIYRTLEEVMAFYNRGGGAGLGLDVPNQTLSPDRLNLSASEQQAVISFLKTLTDTVNTNVY